MSKLSAKTLFICALAVTSCNKRQTTSSNEFAAAAKRPAWLIASGAPVDCYQITNPGVLGTSSTIKQVAKNYMTKSPDIKTARKFLHLQYEGKSKAVALIDNGDSGYQEPLEILSYEVTVSNEVPKLHSELETVRGRMNYFIENDVAADPKERKKHPGNEQPGKALLIWEQNSKKSFYQCHP